MVSPIYTGGPAIRLMLATNSVKRLGRRLRVGEALLLATGKIVKCFLQLYYKTAAMRLKKPGILGFFAGFFIRYALSEKAMMASLAPPHA